MCTQPWLFTAAHCKSTTFELEISKLPFGKQFFSSEAKSFKMSADVKWQEHCDQSCVK